MHPSAGAATLQFIADQKPGSVAPENGSTARYLVQQVLNYTASEVHAGVGPLFNPTISAEVKAHVLASYKKKLTYVNDTLLAGKTFVVGESFTIADAYLMIVLSWSPYVGLDLAEFPVAAAYLASMKALPAVAKAFEFIATTPTHTS
jgi:glutathione S-transferase